MQLRLNYQDPDFEYHSDQFNVAAGNDDAPDLSSCLQEIVRQTTGLREKYTHHQVGQEWHGCRLLSLTVSMTDRDGKTWEEPELFDRFLQDAQLEPLLLNYVDLTGNNFYQGFPQFGYRLKSSGRHYAGQYLATRLALNNKQYIIKYALHLTDTDLSPELNHTSDINQILNKWGICMETLFLLAIRVSAGAGQHGLEQFYTLMQNPRFRSLLVDDNNLDHFARYLALGICYQFNKYLAYPSDSKADFFSEFLFRHAMNRIEWLSDEQDTAYSKAVDLLPDVFREKLQEHNDQAVRYYLDQVTRVGFHNNIAYG